MAAAAAPRLHPCREDTCSLCVSNHTPAVQRVPNGLALSRWHGRMRSRCSLPLGAVWGGSGRWETGMENRGRGGGGFEGRVRAKGRRVCVCVWCACACACVCVCVLPLPIRAFNMPSRDPLLRTAHASLGCQDNGQQARAVTPHFPSTELSNHDRCRQCRRRHY